MKSQITKFCVFALVLSLSVAEAQAQRGSRRRGNPPANSGTQTQTQNTEQNNTNRVSSGYDPYGGVPIEVDSSGEQGIVRKSLRSNDATDKSRINERTPLPYEHLRWDDALYAEKVWRELDLREKMNQTFRYEAEDENGSQMFFNILMDAIKNDSVVAFSDDRFTLPLSLEEQGNITAGGLPDTQAVRDVNDPNKIVKYVVTRTAFDPKEIMKLRIKEEWVFDRESSRLVCRILGIAPVKEIKRGNSVQSQVLFWVYYPDLRKTLARYEVYNPKNMGYGRMTWEELFESRMFSSFITKSTLDNPGNKTIKQMFAKDQILALLEGENIKERIFNYEQDLWQY